MAADRDSGAKDGGHADSSSQQMPAPGTAFRILELMKSESGAEEWALWLRAPLAHAVNKDDGDLTAALLDAAGNPTQVDSEGVPILGVAAKNGHVGVISTVATRHPETLNHTEAGSGYGALHHAAKNNKTESIDALVEAGAYLELQDLEGCTALHVAAATAGCESAVAALLRHDADKEQVQNDALTPLLVAVRAGNEGAATVLIEAGASLVGGHNDEKVLELAISGESMNGGAARSGCINIMRTLVHRGVDVGFSSAGVTAMHWAAWYDNAPAIDFLAEMGADIEAKADEGATPFHVSAQTAGNLTAIRALWWHKADVNARKSNGDTPLHVAAHNCFSERSPSTVRALLLAGADETMTNNASETPADVLEKVAAEFEEEGNCFVEQIRKLLANAPADRADRAWARRRFVVMCRRFPGRLRLQDISPSSPVTDSTNKSPKKAALRKADDGKSSTREAGATNGDFSGAMGSLMGLQRELFRAIVEFL